MVLGKIGIVQVVLVVKRSVCAIKNIKCINTLFDGTVCVYIVSSSPTYSRQSDTMSACDSDKVSSKSIAMS